MLHNDKFVVTNQSITPLISKNETQVIFQRHCNYDRVNGGLILESSKDQTELAKTFMQKLITESSLEEKMFLFFL